MKSGDMPTFETFLKKKKKKLPLKWSFCESLWECGLKRFNAEAQGTTYPSLETAVYFFTGSAIRTVNMLALYWKMCSLPKLPENVMTFVFLMVKKICELFP